MAMSDISDTVKYIVMHPKQTLFGLGAAGIIFGSTLVGCSPSSNPSSYTDIRDAENKIVELIKAQTLVEGVKVDYRVSAEQGLAVFKVGDVTYSIMVDFNKPVSKFSTESKTQSVFTADSGDEASNKSGTGHLDGLADYGTISERVGDKTVNQHYDRYGLEKNTMSRKQTQDAFEKIITETLRFYGQ